MYEHPVSWESLENPPSLRQPSPEEYEIIESAKFPKEYFTHEFAVKLVLLYAEAVGYKTDEQLFHCLSVVGLWDYQAKSPLLDKELVELHGSEGIDWRIGSPDWVNTKLTVRRWNDSGRPDDNLLVAKVYPNVPYDWDRGLSEHDIRAQLYFAEMAKDYIATLESEKQ